MLRDVAITKSPMKRLPSERWRSRFRVFGTPKFGMRWVSCCTDHRSVPRPYLRKTHGRQMTAAAAFYGTVMRLTVVSRIWEGEKLCFKKRFSGSVVFWCCRGGYVCDRLTVKMPNARRYNRAAPRSTMDKPYKT